MQQIDNLSDYPNQITHVLLPDGSIADMAFQYKPRIQRWFFDIDHPLVSAKGNNLCCHPNLLRQWRTRIPFGMACVSTDGADPFYIGDFSSGRVTVYMLSASEVQQIEAGVLSPTAWVRR